MTTHHELTKRLAALSVDYETYVDALAETVPADARLHAVTVQKWRQVAADLKRAANLLGFTGKWA